MKKGRNFHVIPLDVWMTYDNRCQLNEALDFWPDDYTAPVMDSIKVDWSALVEPTALDRKRAKAARQRGTLRPDPEPPSLAKEQCCGIQMGERHCKGVSVIVSTREPKEFPRVDTSLPPEIVFMDLVPGCPHPLWVWIYGVRFIRENPFTGDSSIGGELTMNRTDGCAPVERLWLSGKLYLPDPNARQPLPDVRQPSPNGKSGRADLTPTRTR